jgi:tetratricopeptide (TPR) repeat protein
VLNTAKNDRSVTEAVIQKVYAVLGGEDKEKTESLCQALSGLFPHGNLTSNLYLLAEDLREGMPQAERIQKEVNAFLRGNLLARIYVHFIHRLTQDMASKADFYYQYYYQNWKRTTREFDQEAYGHQEVPRLMLLPVIVPDSTVEPRLLAGFLDTLRRAFLLPSLYLHEGTCHFGNETELFNKAEKVYFGRGKGSDMGAVLAGLWGEGLVHDTSARLDTRAESIADPCPSGLIVSAEDGMVYPCLEAFLRKKGLVNIYENLDVEAWVDRYGTWRQEKGDCTGCRERVVLDFSDLPLPQAAKHELGDLLFHFGARHQEREDYIRAVERYGKSLELSPIEDEAPVYFKLGLCYTSLGDYDQALRSYDRTQGTYQDQYYFHFYTGLCYFHKGDFQGALERFTRALDMNPVEEDLTSILLYVGTCHNSLADYERAVVHLERAKQEGGHGKEVYNALGFSYFQMKDYDRAIANLQRAVALDPYSAIDYASLGANYRDKGDKSMAIAMYEKALELDPSLAAARENLDKLRKHHE